MINIIKYPSKIGDWQTLIIIQVIGVCEKESIKAMVKINKSKGIMISAGASGGYWTDMDSDFIDSLISSQRDVKNKACTPI